jgi:hypothetical protein
MTEEPTGPPLTLLTGNGHALIYEANGHEIVPWYRDDWGLQRPGVENFPSYVQSLVRFYEEPEALFADEEPHMDDRPVYGDSGYTDPWFEPEKLPSDPVAEQSEVKQFRPFSVVIDTEAPFPEDESEPPAHEVRIEDTHGDVWYRIRAADYDALYQDVDQDAPDAVAEFTTALRLMYEKPRVFVGRHQKLADQ